MFHPAFLRGEHICRSLADHRGEADKLFQPSAGIKLDVPTARRFKNFFHPPKERKNPSNGSISCLSPLLRQDLTRGLVQLLSAFHSGYIEFALLAAFSGNQYIAQTACPRSMQSRPGY